MAKKTTCKNTNNQERESEVVIVTAGRRTGNTRKLHHRCRLSRAPSELRKTVSSTLSHPGFGIPAYGLCVSNPHALHGWRPRKQYI